MDLASNDKMSDQCTSDDEVGKFICFRIMKDLDIEPESTHDVHSEANFLLARQCVCGCGDDVNETMTENEESDEFLSAFEEGEHSSAGGGNSSSASSFAFPVLDARWSGSPVKMPKRKPHDNRNLTLLRKPKRAARIVCRWCISF